MSLSTLVHIGLNLLFLNGCLIGACLEISVTSGEEAELPSSQAEAVATPLDVGGGGGGATLSADGIASVVTCGPGTPLDSVTACWCSIDGATFLK